MFGHSSQLLLGFHEIGPGETNKRGVREITDITDIINVLLNFKLRDMK